MPQRVRQRQSVVYVRSDVGIDPDSHGDRSLNGFVHISETSLPIGQLEYESAPMVLPFTKGMGLSLYRAQACFWVAIWCRAGAVCRHRGCFVYLDIDRRGY